MPITEAIPLQRYRYARSCRYRYSDNATTTKSAKERIFLVRRAAAQLQSAGPVLLADPDIVWRQRLVAAQPVLLQHFADVVPRRNDLARPSPRIHHELYPCLALGFIGQIEHIYICQASAPIARERRSPNTDLA